MRRRSPAAASRSPAATSSCAATGSARELIVVRNRARRLRHHRRAELDRLVRRLPRVLEDRRHPTAGVGEAARPRAGGHRRARRLEGRDRRPGRGVRAIVRFDHPPAARARAGTRVQRRAAARRGVAGVEGADVRWLDRPSEADRVRRPGALRHRRAGAARRPRRRLHARARPAVPQRSGGLVVPGLVAGQPRGACSNASTPRRCSRRSSGTAST